MYFVVRTSHLHKSAPRHDGPDISNNWLVVVQQEAKSARWSDCVELVKIFHMMSKTLTPTCSL